VATATGPAQSLAAAQLKGALVTKVGTARPAALAEAGDYGALPDMQIGNEARALNVKAAGYSQVNVWSVVYRADGFVGAVTIVGPDASQASAKKLASQATRTSASRCPSLTAAAAARANW